MNKYIYEKLINSIKRGLNESGLFDEDDDDLIYIDDDEDLSNVLSDNLKITSLLQCKSLEEVNGYLTDKFGVYDTVKEAMDAIRNHTALPDNVTFAEYGINPYWYIKIPSLKNSGITNKDVSYKVEKKADKADIIYKNKQVYPEFYEIRFNGCYDDNKIKYHLVTKSPSDINYRSTYEKALEKTIEQYDIEHTDEFESNLYNFILKNILATFNTQKIADDLSCEGKVYKVVQKDIDRMSKCLRTGQYAGFDAITKPEKMVARLAAFFIVADMQGRKDMKLGFNDEILLSVLGAGSLYSTTRSRGTYVEVLRAINRFPSIHLKDVIATYSAYKDKF